MPPQEQVGDNAEFKSYPGLKKSDYEHRMHNASLARLDISQLRAEMEYYGLDTTGIRFKWECIDRIERHRRERGFGFLRKTTANESSIAKGAGFTSLPAELRNAIYEMVLVSTAPFTIHYLEDGDSMHVLDHIPRSHRYPYRLHQLPHPGLEQIRNFAALSLVNPQVGTEARTFFYANNAFRFCAMPYTITCARYRRTGSGKVLSPPYFAAYVRWLDRLGTDGRAAVQELVLTDERKRGENFDFMIQYERFFTLLCECRNLTSLTLSVTADHITASDPPAYYQYLLHRSTLPRKALRTFASHFSSKNLPRLTSLIFIYTISAREYMAYDVMAVGRKKRGFGLWFARDLAAQRIGALMTSMKSLVENVTRAEVQIRRVPLIHMEAVRWKGGYYSRYYYVQRYYGLRRGGIKQPGDGRTHWWFQDS